MIPFFTPFFSNCPYKPVLLQAKITGKMCSLRRSTLPYIILLLDCRKSFVITETSLYRGSLYRVLLPGKFANFGEHLFQKAWLHFERSLVVNLQEVAANHMSGRSVLTTTLFFNLHLASGVCISFKSFPLPPPHPPPSENPGSAHSPRPWYAIS